MDFASHASRCQAVFAPFAIRQLREAPGLACLQASLCILAAVSCVLGSWWLGG